MRNHLSFPKFVWLFVCFSFLVVRPSFSQVQWNCTQAGLPQTPTCPQWNEDTDTRLTYHFEEELLDTSILDSAPASPGSPPNNGQIAGPHWYRDVNHDGRSGKSLHMGMYDYIIAQNSASLQITKALKIDFWISFDDQYCPLEPPPVGDWCVRDILKKGDSYGVYIKKQPPPKPMGIPTWELHFYTNDSEDLVYKLCEGQNPPAGWMHVECTFDGGVKKLLINDQLMKYTPSHASEDLTAGGKNIDISTWFLMIGGAGNGFHGWIDDVRVYSKAKIDAVKLRIDPDHPLYFQNVTDTDQLRDHVFLIGDGQREDLFMWENQAYHDDPEHAENNPDAMSALEYLQWLSDYNLNYSRTNLMNWQTWGCDFPDQWPIPQCGYERQSCGCATQCTDPDLPPCPCDASDFCGPFNIRAVPSHMDVNYFQNRLACFNQYAKHRGIFVEYTLFDAWLLRAPWKYSIWKTSIVPDPNDNPPHANKNGTLEGLEVPPDPPPPALPTEKTRYDEIFGSDQADDAFIGADATVCNSYGSPPNPDYDGMRRCWLWLVQTSLIYSVAFLNPNNPQNQGWLANDDNYIFEICNENKDPDVQPSPTWTEHMVNYISSQFGLGYDPNHSTRKKLKSVDRKKLGGLYVGYCAECGNDCDIVDVHLNPAQDSMGGLDSVRDTLTQLASAVIKPRINNEHYDPQYPEAIWPSKVAWATFIGGGHYQRHECSWREGKPTLTTASEELSDFEKLTKFVHNTFFWFLRPDDSFISVVSGINCPRSYHGMANPDPLNEYVVYIAVPSTCPSVTTGKIKLNLSSAQPVLLDLEWYRPDVGIGSFHVDPFSPILLENNQPMQELDIPPFQQQIALHIKRHE
jgi:hypothetical protein